MQQLQSTNPTDEAYSRKVIWRRRIMMIERDPELAAVIDTMSDLAMPPETFDEDKAKYAGIAATANDYLQFGHFSHCGRCYQTVALYPSHKLNFPDMTPHECGGLEAFSAWDRKNRRDLLTVPTTQGQRVDSWRRRPAATS